MLPPRYMPVQLEELLARLEKDLEVCKPFKELSEEYACSTDDHTTKRKQLETPNGLKEG
jgi:hypothetical protein